MEINVVRNGSGSDVCLRDNTDSKLNTHTNYVKYGMSHRSQLRELQQYKHWKMRLQPPWRATLSLPKSRLHHQKLYAGVSVQSVCSWRS